MKFTENDRNILFHLMKHEAMTVVNLASTLHTSRQNVYNSLRKLQDHDIVVKDGSEYSLNPAVSFEEECKDVGDFLLKKIMKLSDSDFKDHYSDNPPYYILLAIVQLTYDSIEELKRFSS